MGDWKLIVDSEDGTARLFNHAHDPGERRDCAAEYPEVVASLQDTLSAYHVRFRMDSDRLSLDKDATRATLSPRIRAQLRAQDYLE